MTIRTVAESTAAHGKGAQTPVHDRYLQRKLECRVAAPMPRLASLMLLDMGSSSALGADIHSAG